MKKTTGLLAPLGLGVVFLIVLGFGLHSARGAVEEQTRPQESQNTEAGGPPWYLNPAWHYRRLVVISNSGNYLPYYQVLIRLDINNFDFNHARTDGADIRVTHANGTTDLSFWIESWDSSKRLANIWVNVPGVPQGEMPIYLYYGNTDPSVQPASDGNATFDAFDDNWDQFHGEGMPSAGASSTLLAQDQPDSPFAWTVINNPPSVNSGILTVPDGSGIKSSTYQNQAMGMKTNYGLNSLDEYIGFYVNSSNKQWSIVSDNKPGNVNDIFMINTVNGIDFEYAVFPKYNGQNWHGEFHVYELRWKAGQTSGNIDHGESITSTLSARVPNIPLPVTIYNDTTVSSSLLVDWIYLRQYRDPEPQADPRSEQGLVELGISVVDEPDPVGKNTRITYHLTISNTSEINALGVVVTDTLPANTQFASVSSSQGSCEGGSIVLCDLYSIYAFSEAHVTIEVTPTLAGEMINAAATGSPGFELNTGNNYAEEKTLVDWTVPVVNWEKPVPNGGLYLAFGGKVTLEASASDNDQVAKVEFRLWDHRCGVGNPPPGCWVSIGYDTTYPYQVQFNTSVLAVNDPYQVFVVGVDRAGNVSNPYSPLQRIFIERRLPVFMPVIRK